MNCKLSGHVRDTCFSKGGGMENDVPDWWKEKQAAKEKKSSEKSANATSKDSTKEKDNNYALLTIPTAVFHVDNNKELALVVTSGHDHGAYAVSTSTGVIIDCGASSHFPPTNRSFSILKRSTLNPLKPLMVVPSVQLAGGISALCFPPAKAFSLLPYAPPAFTMPPPWGLLSYLFSVSTVQAVPSSSKTKFASFAALVLNALF
jgi:hypothetical protein